MSLSQSSSVLTFRVNSSSGTYVTGSTIKSQVLTLQNVRVQFASAAEALAAQVVYLDVPWLNSNHLVDGLLNLYLLPIPLDNAICTQYTCNIPISMSDDADTAFKYRIVDSSGVAPTGFSNITLQFTYNTSFI
jgi:hypothetical protein